MPAATTAARIILLNMTGIKKELPSDLHRHRAEVAFSGEYPCSECIELVAYRVGDFATSRA
jgi:hypothetical protein